MSLKIHALVDGVATLGNGKELLSKDRHKYTVIRNGLRMENTTFAQLRVDDLVLCWGSGDNGKVSGKAT